MLSRLKPDSATMVGILTALGVYMIYNNALPSATEIRTANANNPDVESARKAAAWKSALLISGVFLVARDLNSYIISGASLVGLDYIYKHSNSINPNTKQVDMSSSGLSVAPGLSDAYAMPDYSEDAA